MTSTPTEETTRINAVTRLLQAQDAYLVEMRRRLRQTQVGLWTIGFLSLSGQSSQWAIRSGAVNWIFTCTGISAFYLLFRNQYERGIVDIDRERHILHTCTPRKPARLYEADARTIIVRHHQKISTNRFTIPPLDVSNSLWRLEALDSGEEA